MMKVNSLKILTDKNLHKQDGFTLLEVLIALTILGILSFTVVNSIKIMRDHDHYQDNRVVLEEIRESLLLFVQVNGYLPCPDTNNDGREEARHASGICSNNRGFLPYLDLGVRDADSWGTPFYYAVHDDATTVANAANADSATSYFNATGAPSFNLGAEPIGTPTALGSYLRICTNQSPDCNSGTTAANMLERAALAVVLSFGKNGRQTVSRIAGNTTVVLSAKELINADGNDYFWQARGSNVEGQEFDDQLVWVTGYDLKFAVMRTGNSLSW